MFMITNFKIFPNNAFEINIVLGALSFNSYIIFITNEKPHFSLSVVFIVA